ncbi:MAG TPA: TetR/AcrR family transcriptional regulator [Terriglobales bacterium]|nr:TetR/AcrR family transcriptional regulator [Terriglobales bacterium]
MRSRFRSRSGQNIPSNTGLPVDSRFNRRLTEILAHASDVFCEKGYEGASMRDLSRASGMSLAGLYHYFGSKERLLYLIQKHTFSTIVAELKSRLETSSDPAERVRIFIQNHLEYFTENQSGLKVLAHEDEALKNGFHQEISAIKREYYRICLGLMDELKRARKLDFNSRTAVMSLFGMINWIYTWYNPRYDGSAQELGGQMSAIILSGVCGAAHDGGRHGRKAHAGKLYARKAGARKGRGLRRAAPGSISKRRRQPARPH